MFFSYQCSSKKFSQIVVYAREEWKDEPETKESRKEFYAPPQNVVRQICFGPTIGAVCLSPHFVVLAVVVDVIVMPLCVVFFILLATICNFYLFFVAWVIKTLKSVTIMCNMSQWRCVNIPRQATSMTLSRVPRHCFDDVYLIWWHRRNVCCACALCRWMRRQSKKRRYWNLFTFPDNKHKITIASPNINFPRFPSTATFLLSFFAWAKSCSRFALNLDFNAF